ncbi:MAG: polysaccharide deacetylase family protein [Rhizobiales bacterium]|nr:polysaccharide deacetylase family protein [Hyphomicrobiales bacterium]
MACRRHRRPARSTIAALPGAAYGGKVGVWRILALLNRHGIRGTFCVNARCAEIFPEAVAAIIAQGHDAAGHGYLQDQLLTALEPGEEQAVIRKSLDILEGATGKRPSGWISPVTAYTAHTRRFLAADKLTWHGDARDTDLPSLVETPAGPIVQIPGSDFTDNRVIRSSPQDIWDVYKETFDYLRDREPPAFLALSLHCHFGGRPMITAVYDKIFSYMRRHDDVWFSSFGEIARWVMDTQRDADTHPRRLLSTP